MRDFLIVFFLIAIGISVKGQLLDPEELDSDSLSEVANQEIIDYVAMMAYSDSVESTFEFKRGVVDIGDGLATVNVPKGYKYLGPEESKIVLEDLWGNPEGQDNYGMLFFDGILISSDSSYYAIVIDYSPEGYVEDDDAADIDYDELLVDLQTESTEDNKLRAEAGYTEIQLVGWAAKPFYDEENKKLHWAKELHFEGNDTNTLNYNIRILGRRGYLLLNVVSDMEYLPLVNNDIDKILESVDFSGGNMYSDFDPDYDTIAAVGIGGLVAGKLIAKGGGILLLLAKGWKFILIGLAAIAGVWKKITGQSDNG